MHLLGKDRDKQILELFRRGKDGAMDSLYAAYADYLMGVCSRYIADDDDRKDVMQESLIKIFTRIGDFRYQGEGSLKAWMARIVVNESLMMIRSKHREQTLFSDREPPDNTLPEEEAPPDTDLSTDVLVKLINQLPDGYRMVFNLFAVEGLSHKEIADILGIKQSTSASQYFKARAQLARLIREYKHQNLHS